MAENQIEKWAKIQARCAIAALVLAFLGLPPAWYCAYSDYSAKSFGTQSMPTPQHFDFAFVAMVIFYVGAIVAGTGWVVLWWKKMNAKKTSPPPSETRPVPPRLKIIEAHYGVEGINDPDVTHYLLERQHGDHFAEPVGADLFHGFDPVAGMPKRLRIRYSLDGRETIVERPEHTWMILPEDSFLKKQVEDLIYQLKLNESQYNSDLSRSREFYEQCKAEKKELSEKLEVFTPLQLEAVHLAEELISFLREVGPPPAPRYTFEEIQRMSSAQTRKLIEENDGDFAEACEFYAGKGTMRLTTEGLYKQLKSYNLRMWPWYDKVADLYEERFRAKVESLKRRFTIEGIPADSLLIPVTGPQGPPNIASIIAQLWELAYKVKGKDLPNYQDPRMSKGRVLPENG